VDPHTGKIDLKKVQTADSHPYGIAINSRDVPVFCEFGTNEMASINRKSMGSLSTICPRVRGRDAW
jgi:hypothetical protein